MLYKASCCAFVAVFLAGCVNDVRPSVQPPIVSYSFEFQRQAADEIKSLPGPCERQVADAECSAVHRLIIDYLLMRDQVRSVD